MTDIPDEFSPRWLYHRCTHCQRVVTSVVTERGDWMRQMPCQQILGTPLPACVGILVQGTEQRPADFPLRAQHDPDFEWYRPTSVYTMQRMKAQAPKLYEYVIRGGLVLRPASGRYSFPSTSLGESHESHER